MTTVVAVEPQELGVLITEMELPKGDQARLELLQGILGGYLELVPTQSASLWLFCNEDGQRLGLQSNVLGTVLAQQLILGPVIFHGGADAAGELVSIPEAYRAILLNCRSN